MEQWLIFLGTGAFAGVLAGLFGVGGGLIMVPALALVLPLQGVPEDVFMQVAIGTSLAVIAATSIASTLAHHRRGAVDWPALRHFAPGLALGALAGAFVADALSGQVLRRIVGIGAILVAVQMSLPRHGSACTAGLRAGSIELVCAGAAIGLLSALVGIGGGSLSVPYLSARGLPVLRAVGSAAAGGIPIAWAGALGFMVAGWHAPGVPAPHLGYVSLSAFIALAAASVLCAPLGVRLAHRLPAGMLKRGFALLLLLVGARLSLG
ncbi:sulfite exporter TauE/SafE family protein [Sinimarinibacterium thermocellulolyticum]|uniref:Probable membrane transporter protein n=1 Tax=Sinimarinibacterium thermocellulolyticum TaxID=3170016 RepID=A0ABV2A752_9GAMM